jgi:hypothetical protein
MADGKGQNEAGKEYVGHGSSWKNTVVLSGEDTEA